MELKSGSAVSKNDNCIDVVVLTPPDKNGNVKLRWTRPGAGPDEAGIQSVLDWVRCAPTFPGARRLTVEFAAGAVR